MPYKSKAQQRYMHAAAGRGEIEPSVVKEFDEATKGHYKDLPDRAKKEAMFSLGTTLMKCAAVSDEEVKRYGAFRSQALTGMPRAEAMLAGARKVKAEHPAQYYLNPLVPGPLTHGLAALGQRAAATAANAPIRSALAVGGASAVGAAAGNLISQQMMGRNDPDVVFGQAGGQLAGGLAGILGLAAVGNKKRQQHARELYAKILKKHED